MCTRVLWNTNKLAVLAGRTMDWPTTVTDLTNKRYFFELTNSPNVIWAELGKVDLQAGAPPLALDPDDIELSGDVSARFRESEAPF